MPRWPKDHKKKLGSKVLTGNQCLQCCLLEQKERFRLTERLGEFYIKELGDLQEWYVTKALDFIPVAALSHPVTHGIKLPPLSEHLRIADPLKAVRVTQPIRSFPHARPFPEDAVYIDKVNLDNVKRVNWLVKTKYWPTFEIKRVTVEKGFQFAHSLVKKLQVVELVLEPMRIMERFLEELKLLQHELQFDCRLCIEERVLKQANNTVPLDACDWIGLRTEPTPNKLLENGAEPPCEVLVEAGVKRRVRSNELKDIYEAVKEFEELPDLEDLAIGPEEPSE